MDPICAMVFIYFLFPAVAFDTLFKGSRNELGGFCLASEHKMWNSLEMAFIHKQMQLGSPTTTTTTTTKTY